MSPWFGPAHATTARSREASLVALEGRTRIQRLACCRLRTCASELHGKLSMRASVTSSLSFAECRLPESAILPGAKGLKSPLACLTQARYGIGWGVIGAAMDCYETARSYSVLRKQFDDRPIASHQLVQEKLANMITEITKAQLLALHIGRLKDKGAADSAHISMLKAQQRRDGGSTAPALPATCWAPTALWTNIRSCATCVTSKR